ncbi:MAG: hotdog domain-containing protein [Candidatus Acidiferrales bacterium]
MNSQAPSDVPSPVELRIGLEGRFERAVIFEYTTAYYDPKLPEIFSTPAMIAMMEAATSHAVDRALPPGKISVGTRIEVDHLRSTGIGSLVVSTARLAEINGRYLTFDVESRTGEEVLGRGRIVRAIIDLARIKQKLAQPPPANR